MPINVKSLIINEEGKLTQGAQIGAQTFAAIGKGIFERRKRKKEEAQAKKIAEAEMKRIEEQKKIEQLRLEQLRLSGNDKKSNVGLYVGIGVGVLALTGVIIYLVKIKK